MPPLRWVTDVPDDLNTICDVNKESSADILNVSECNLGICVIDNFLDRYA